MPERQSPFDDSLADLFGRLPAPRSARAPHSEGGESAPTSAPDAEAVPAAQADAPAPTSRRAARQAAAAPAEAEPVDTDAAPESGPPPGVAEARASVPAASAPQPDSWNPAPAWSPAPDTSVLPAAAADEQGEPAPGPRRTPTGSQAVATATLDDLFGASGGGQEPPRGGRKRRSGRVGGWIILGVILVLIGGIAGGAWFVWTSYEEPIRELMGWEEPKDYAAGEATGEVLVTIVSGDTGSSISQTLYNSGVTKTPAAFYDYLIDTQQNPDFQPGVFALQQRMTSEAALAAILDPASRRENTAQLREGLTVAQSLPLLAEQLSIPLADFEAAVADPSVYGIAPDPAIVAAGGQPLEGWLFPATYTFDPGVTATDVIGRLVTQTQTVLGDLGVPAEDRQRILTTASIIEREGRTADFPKVSRVIANRLAPDNQETFGLLQMDSTAQYGYGEMHDGTVSSSQEALDDPNPWNTYQHAGLPIGPIANPGQAAIDAAMHPADGPWMYFVTVNLETGETIFTNTADEHAQAVEQWQEWCAANPDGGC